QTRLDLEGSERYFHAKWALEVPVGSGSPARSLNLTQLDLYNLNDCRVIGAIRSAILQSTSGAVKPGIPKSCKCTCVRRSRSLPGISAAPTALRTSGQSGKMPLIHAPASLLDHFATSADDMSYSIRTLLFQRSKVTGADRTCGMGTITGRCISVGTCRL